jgi:hypothetical protein
MEENVEVQIGPTSYAPPTTLEGRPPDPKVLELAAELKGVGEVEALLPQWRDPEKNRGS